MKFESHQKLIYDQVLKSAKAVCSLLSGKQTFEGFEMMDEGFFPNPRSDLRLEFLALHRMLCIGCFGSWFDRFFVFAHFPCKNSRERKSDKTFEDPFINSISKSKTDKIACHLAKICFETKF